jgi:hypothetical protein
METDIPHAHHPSYPLLSADDERKLFTRVYNPTLKADALFCVLPQKWFESWVAYTGFDRNAVDNLRARGVGGESRAKSSASASSSSSSAAASAMEEDEDMEAEEGAEGRHSVVRRGGGERPGYIDCSILLAEPPAHIDLPAPAPLAASSSAAYSKARLATTTAEPAK